MQYCIYLRKSRADAEAEERGEGETLARHQAALLELAKRQNLCIKETYREIVSGETIAARPVIQRLLSDVGQGLWSGVLVMEVERLARGDTVDQGIIAQTFKFTGTRIITPMKAYDPDNEFDEEYFEFGLFMSRREYKTINRRLQRGRLDSIREGKYAASRPPYGYRKIKLEKEKGYTLAPVPEEADAVRLIFKLYTLGEEQPNGYHRLGATRIARRLNDLLIPPQRGTAWSASSVRDILINPVYAGKLRWNWRPAAKKISGGAFVTQRPRNAQKCILTQGLQEPIIDMDVFEKTQKLMSEKNSGAFAERKNIKNPLCGLVICGGCGRKMIRRPPPADSGRPDTLICPNTSCKNISSALPLVENRIMKVLDEWLDGYKINWDTVRPPEDPLRAERQKALRRLEAQLETLRLQLNNIHDFLERGVYDTAQFYERIESVNEKLRQTEETRNALLAGLQAEETKKEIKIPDIQRLADVYSILSGPKAKNEFLKDILHKVIYYKEKNGRWHNPPDGFEIILYPKLPQNNPIMTDCSKLPDKNKLL